MCADTQVRGVSARGVNEKDQREPTKVLNAEAAFCVTRAPLLQANQISPRCTKGFISPSAKGSSLCAPSRHVTFRRRADESSSMKSVCTAFAPRDSAVGLVTRSSRRPVRDEEKTGSIGRAFLLSSHSLFFVTALLLHQHQPDLDHSNQGAAHPSPHASQTAWWRAIKAQEGMTSL